MKDWPQLLIGSHRKDKIILKRGIVHHSETRADVKNISKDVKRTEKWPFSLGPERPKKPPKSCAGGRERERKDIKEAKKRFFFFFFLSGDEVFFGGFTLCFRKSNSNKKQLPCTIFEKTGERRNKVNTPFVFGFVFVTPKKLYRFFRSGA